MTEQAPTHKLRRVLAEDGCAAAVGAYDPTVAKLVEEAGFPVVYVSGSATATSVAGFPDVGLLGLSELADNARHIVNAVSVPVLCDVDTGFGNTTSVVRTIREFEALGAAGVHIEDQTFPKRCGQTAGAGCIETAEMVAKIYAAKEAQLDDSFVVIVRTDARQCEGLDAMLTRCQAYAEAGADALFPEALESHDEFRRVGETLEMPLAIDLPEWGRSPMLSLDELGAFGFDLGIYAVSAMRVALAAARSFLETLSRDRSQESWLDRMMSRDELDRLLGLSAIRVEEERLEQLGKLAADRIGRPQANAPGAG